LEKNGLQSDFFQVSLDQTKNNMGEKIYFHARLIINEINTSIESHYRVFNNEMPLTAHEEEKISLSNQARDGSHLLNAGN